MKTRIGTENRGEELQLNQEGLEFEWPELTTNQHLTGEKPLRKGIRLNHNETLVSDDKRPVG